MGNNGDNLWRHVVLRHRGALNNFYGWPEISLRVKVEAGRNGSYNLFLRKLTNVYKENEVVFS
jgi:hypothetical protein